MLNTPLVMVNKLIRATFVPNVTPALAPVLFSVKLFNKESVAAALKLTVGLPPVVPEIVKLEVEEPAKAPVILEDPCMVNVFPFIAKIPEACPIVRVPFACTLAFMVFVPALLMVKLLYVVILAGKL